MIRVYCDVCSAEVTGPAKSPQPQFDIPVDWPRNANAGDQIKVRLIRSLDGVWNGGDLCGTCLAKVLRHIVAQLEPPTPPALVRPTPSTVAALSGRRPAAQVAVR